MSWPRSWGLIRQSLGACCAQASCSEPPEARFSVVSGRWSVVSSRVGAAILGAVVAAGMLAHIALADATPVQLVLLYMPNVSNTGTPAASGIAELVMPE